MSRYILLSPGDEIRLGDEYWSESLGLWDEITPNIIHWWGHDHKVKPNGRPVRRKDSCPKDAKARIRRLAKAMATGNRVNTTEHFWDCECETDYIHPKTDTECSVCLAHHSEQPDSRVAEVILYLLE